MTVKNIIGIDHAVVMVRELAKAAENWRRLGFTISPRGTHSAHMGTGNVTIMLDPDYIELLGVLHATELNTPARAFLERREGIERIAFTAVDAAQGAEEIRARGLVPIGPTEFERPVTMPDGRLAAARFRTFQWPVQEAPGGTRIFACQHKTRETVWIAELMRHANGARRLKQVLITSPEPEKEAAHLSRLTDLAARREADGAIAVPSGVDRAEFVFLTKQQLGRRYTDVALDDLAERGGAGLVIASSTLAATTEAVGALGLRRDDRICVPPAAANGTLLVFEDID
ncbi:MAG: VOC family protein [Bradyrhizobium sp.]|uniref:VOC family protein n=1 Tax=Bradyrhizobium sp. TaxID=376 RepID=UPI001D6F6843|nr:VOC family protein [Bradyrhizobium sp.]MBV9562109.1 VOC family protein [Bradyrhizobium sp.]